MHSTPSTPSPPPSSSSAARLDGSASPQGSQIGNSSQLLCQSCGVETGQGGANVDADADAMNWRGGGGGGSGGGGGGSSSRSSSNNLSPLSPRSDAAYKAAAAAATVAAATAQPVVMMAPDEATGNAQKILSDRRRSDEVINGGRSSNAGVKIQQPRPQPGAVDCPGSLVPAAPPSELKYGDRLRLWTRYVVAAAPAAAAAAVDAAVAVVVANKAWPGLEA